jgi:hypothetical protein
MRLGGIGVAVIFDNRFFTDASIFHLRQQQIAQIVGSHDHSLVA